LAARRERLSYCGEEVRRHDPDRFLTALYAPSGRRESLLTLYAFNLEIAKVRETVSEPMLGEIRLQWWREAIESAYGGGPVRRHAVVEPLTDAIREHRLTRSHFDRLIDARAFDLGDAPPPSVAALVDYAESTSATLLWLALDALGAGQDEAAHAAARAVGIAWAILGLIRAMPHHLRQGRIYLPADLESEFRVERRGLRELKSSPELAAAVESLAARARGSGRECRRKPCRRCCRRRWPTATSGGSRARATTCSTRGSASVRACCRRGSRCGRWRGAIDGAPRLVKLVGNEQRLP
jgi:NADH dehydrogenase [ubiquinone] 1 alpha subcomplex assembly factor 6